MANGHPDFELAELPALERFFAPLADVLEDFAARHRLRLVKYDNQNRSWDFIFRHPRGGTARIQVLQASDNESVLLAAHWEMSDFVAFRRSTFSTMEGTLPREGAQVAAMLSALLVKLVTLPTHHLTPDGVNYELYWRTDALEQVRLSQMELPLPLL